MRVLWSGARTPRRIRCHVMLPGGAQWQSESGADGASTPEGLTVEGCLDGMTAGLRALCVPVWTGRATGGGCYRVYRGSIVDHWCGAGSRWHRALDGLTAFARWTAQPESMVWSGATMHGGTLGLCRVVCYRGEPCATPVVEAERGVGAIQSLARWLDTPDAEPVPVWSGTGWDRGNLGYPLATVLIDGEVAPARGDAFARAYAASLAVEVFARWLCTPYVGWRPWHPDRPPREDEAILWLDRDGDLVHDREGWLPQNWDLWRQNRAEIRHWRYASEVLP